MVRSPFAADAAPASDVVVTLGMLAEERGTDSSGLALLGGRPGLAGSGPARDGDGCRVLKGRGRFSAVWRPELLPELDRAPVVLGHTRWATQGTPADPANAGPMVVPGTAGGSPGIVATHNGDIDADDLRSRHAPPPACGTTDSEPVFQLLADCDGTSDVTGVLESLVGRAALAWVHRDRPTEVHLARAALSPLTVAVDTEHNIYWASNPRWFREAEKHTRVRFATVVMLREGTYLKVGMERRPGRRDLPDVLATATFMPTARDSDMDDRVWTRNRPGLQQAQPAGYIRSTTWSMQAVRASTSSGSMAGNMPMRSWLRPSLR
ncbi:glutamine amidotransferase-like protein [Actinomadura hallensis]|uniref:Glutamine amidotransferase-like protein n=1 Tax=Actinomadura hallensis TaxID=337895 RepID=A0A543I9W8_9ACTN|nr:glutamine amidotransferase-like protein [Actinomadura hallensis]